MVFVVEQTVMRAVTETFHTLLTQQSCSFKRPNPLRILAVLSSIFHDEPAQCHQQPNLPQLWDHTEHVLMRGRHLGLFIKSFHV